MAAKYDIKQLFRVAFPGLPIPFYIPERAEGSVAKDGYDDRTGDNVLNLGDYTETSLDGSPVWDVFKFARTNSDDDTYTLPAESAVAMRMEKIIVRTPVVGIDGIVKEMISTSDVMLQFRGLFLNYDSDLPDVDALARFKAFFKQNESLKITSKLINRLGIYDVVCEYANMDPVSDSPNAWSFELTCYEDKEIILEVQDV